MKHLKTVISTVVVVAVLSFSLASCGQSKETSSTSIDFKGYPISGEHEVSYWLSLNSNVSLTAKDLGETEFAKVLQEHTGVNIKFIHPPLGQEKEQLNILLSSNTLPDIIENSWLNFTGGPEKALQEEYIISLNDAIKNYSPNLKAYLAENPEVDKMIKTDSGEYYVYPFIRGDDILKVYCGPIVRQDWLDELDLSAPETMDDWYNMLTLFKEQKGAEAPFAYSANEDIFKHGMFSGAFGVIKGFYINDGKVKYGPMEEGYEDFLKTMNKWYNEGLLDRNFATLDSKGLDANILRSKTGATFGYAGGGIGKWMDANEEDGFNLMPAKYPTEQKGQKSSFGVKDLAYISNGAAAITSSAQNVELAARVLDFGYSKEGHELFNFGIEGKSYNRQGDSYIYTDEILKNTDGLSISAAMGKYMRSNYSGPFVQNRQYVEQYYQLDSQKVALTVWDSDGDKTTLPPITPSPDESRELANIVTNLITYVDEMTMKYIMDKEDLSNYQAFTDTIRGFQVEKAIEIYQQAYDRYNKR